MHSRVLQISRSADDGTHSKVRQSIVRFSRRWATATTPRRVLRRISGTNPWSHGGGLFVDERNGKKFILQAIWPIVDEPDLWNEDPDPDSEKAFVFSAPRIKTDADAALRIGSLDRAERNQQTRERLRPKTAAEDRRPIRLMVEYGVDWPLWNDDGPIEPWELGLSADLTERLRVWNEFWETRHGFDGWRSKKDRKQFKRDEAVLAAALADEVRPFADVEPLDN